MASVAQAVNSISLYAKVPKPRVKQISRHLIDGGDLPKSVGSLSAQIDAGNLATLLLAVFASAGRPVADAPRCATTWGAMTPNGQPLTGSYEDRDRRLVLLELLMYMIRAMWSENGSGPWTGQILQGRFEINTTRPQAIFELGDRTEYLPVGAEKEYSGVEWVAHIPGAALHKIALSLRIGGLHYGPVIPLGPCTAEASHSPQPEIEV